MAWDIDYALDPGRLELLASLDGPRWDGTDGGPARVVLASAQFAGRPAASRRPRRHGQPG